MYSSKFAHGKASAMGCHHNPVPLKQSSSFVAFHVFSGVKSQRKCVRGVRVVASATQKPFPDPWDPKDTRRKWREGFRYEWRWHDTRGPPGAWEKGALSDRASQSFRNGAPEVWDSRPESSARPGKGKKGNGQKASPSNQLGMEHEFQKFSKTLPQKHKSGINLIEESDKYCGKLDQVYVILFGVGEAATEGIYSLRSHCDTTGLHVETIICFESNEEAFRFAGLLEATMVHTPSVHTIRPQDLVRFCTDSGYACRLEAEGSMFMPPEFNVGMTDWERSMRLREGKYKVLEEEPTVDSSHDGEQVLGSDDYPSDPQNSKEMSVNDSIVMELDEVRAMLERLLPDD